MLLSDVNNPTDLTTATYVSGTNGVVANPAEPVLPLEVRNVAAPAGSPAGTLLRGVGFRGGSYSDQGNIFPLTGDPATGIQEVWVTFTGNGSYAGAWQSFNLTQNLSDTKVWTGSLNLASSSLANGIAFMVQAANGAGIVLDVYNAATPAQANLTLNAIVTPTPTATKTPSPSPTPSPTPTSPPANVDLWLDVSDGGIAVDPGGSANERLVFYTLAYANLGTSTATNVKITETVPLNTKDNFRNKIVTCEHQIFDHQTEAQAAT